MQRSKVSETQIVAVLKEAATGVAVKEGCRKYGISDATYYTRYGGLGVSELKRLKELEAESTKLKCMYADLALENKAIKAVLSRKL